jgi:hypothetical protein
VTVGAAGLVAELLIWVTPFEGGPLQWGEGGNYLIGLVVGTMQTPCIACAAGCAKAVAVYLCLNKQSELMMVDLLQGAC